MAEFVHMNDLSEGGFNPARVLQGVCAEDIAERKLRYVASDSWSLQRTSPEIVLTALKGADIRYEHRGGEGKSVNVIVDLKPLGLDALAYVWSYPRSEGGAFVETTLAAVSAEERENVMDLLHERLPLWIPPVVPTEPRCFVNFWMMGAMGPTAHTRSLDVTSWDLAEGNYTQRTHEALDMLMTNFKPAKSGQLLLWHGPPGTGKTWAIRSLAWEWSPWCTTHYIMDPEQMLNGPAGYLDTLLFSQGGPETRYIARPHPLKRFFKHPEVQNPAPTDPDTPPDDEGEESLPMPLFGSDRWRLIVIEDTGELLSRDAKQRTGPGLSRLLNAADGLLGQGSRVIFLITTNEDLGTLHEAVSRPGRAAAQVHFDRLTREECHKWIERNKIDPMLAGAQALLKNGGTVADLYALVNGAQVRAMQGRKGSLGFGGEQ